MLAPERTAGAIVICRHGCALREWLIISGSHRGTIWSVGRAERRCAPSMGRRGGGSGYAAVSYV